MSFTEVGIVGFGPGGCEVAIALAEAGLDIRLIRASRGDGEGARQRIASRLETRVQNGSLSEAERTRIAASIRIEGSFDSLGELDLVVDATRRESKPRRALLATLEGRMPAGAVLATTCAEDLSSMASALRRPDQLVALQVAVRDEGPTIELTFLPDTAPGVRAACLHLCRSIGHEASERPGEPAAVQYREFHIAPALVPVSTGS